MKAAIAREGDCSVEAGIPPWVLRSNCCNAPMRVAGSGEGTHYHECVSCGHACDATDPKAQRPQQEDGIMSTLNANPQGAWLGVADLQDR
jgi:hypothetical protein